MEKPGNPWLLPAAQKNSFYPKQNNQKWVIEPCFWLVRRPFQLIVVPAGRCRDDFPVCIRAGRNMVLKKQKIAADSTSAAIHQTKRNVPGKCPPCTDGHALNWVIFISLLQI